MTRLQDLELRNDLPRVTEFNRCLRQDLNLGPKNWKMLSLEKRKHKGGMITIF